MWDPRTVGAVFWLVHGCVFVCLAGCLDSCVFLFICLVCFFCRNGVFLKGLFVTLLMVGGS